MIFNSPLFLIGLVAVAVPIAVHLFNFRRYKKVYFSNVDRLEQLQSETRRQSRLRELLILAARVLAVVFLVLAFAQPVVPNRDNPLKAGVSDVSVYIDNSFSMENTDGNGTLLDKAKSKAREIVAAYGPTDRFQLLTNDMEGHQFHWLGREEMLEAIDAVEPSSATSPLAAVARRQFDFLHGGTGGNKYAYLVSDFQSSVADFDGFPSDSAVSTLLVPLESAAQDNVFIDSLALNAPVFMPGSGVTATVWLRNEGDENLEKVPLALFVDERQRALAAVDLPARGTTSVEMRFTVEDGGVLNGRVETSDYPVTFDDRYYFSLNVRDRIRMLAVEGRGENEYLRRLFGDDSTVRFDVMNMRQMDFSRIDGNDIILLDELPTLNTGMAQTLKGFVDEGGTLVVVVADDADEQGYNEALRLFNAPQLSGRVQGRVSAGTVNLDNALYRNVFSDRSEEMELPSVTGYHRLATTSGALREAVITLANGDDYVCAVPCGDGHLYLVTAPLRDAHTDFVRQALFVPTLYNMALFSVRPTAPSVSLDGTAPVGLAGRYVGDGQVRLRAASGDFEEIADVRRVGSRCRLVPHGSVHEAGNYLLDDGNGAVEGISFNYSRLESRMDFLGRDALEQLLKDHNLSHCSVVRNVDRPLDSYLKERMEGRRLWRWCVALSLLMLMAEVLLIRLPMRGGRNDRKTERK